MPANRAVDLQQEAARLAASVRDAGSARAVDVRPPDSAIGQSSNRPRSARPTSPSTGCCTSGWRTKAPASAGCRRKASTIRPGSMHGIFGSSTRSTARALISRAAPTGASRSHWLRTAGRSSACLYAPVTEQFFMAIAGQGATCNGAPIAATGGSVAGRIAHHRPAQACGPPERAGTLIRGDPARAFAGAAT